MAEDNDVSELNTIPQVVNINHYGGDTLTIRITIDAAIVAGRTFSAQVRSKTTSRKIDASFSVFPSPTGCDLMLAAVDAQRLTSRGTYEGFWDVQLSLAGSDPITTLGYGDFIAHPDVTRLNQ